METEKKLFASELHQSRNSHSLNGDPPEEFNSRESYYKREPPNNLTSLNFQKNFQTTSL